LRWVKNYIIPKILKQKSGKAVFVYFWIDKNKKSTNKHHFSDE